MFVVLLVLINVLICIFNFIFISIFKVLLWGGVLQHEGWIQRNREMSGTGVHDVEFPNN